MRLLRKKKYFLYLNGSTLVGVEWREGKPHKVIETSIDNLFLKQKFSKGEATLLLNREDVKYQTIPVAVRGKASLKKIAAHEAESLMGLPPTDLVYDWRGIGEISEEGGIHQALYLLATQQRAEIFSLLQKLSLLGLTVTKVISYLDLLIEKGRRLQTRGGSGLMIFEEPFVHFLFFRDGTYGFHRTFELIGEGFQKDLILEIQRSFFYTKQKFKIPIEKVHVLLAPEWFEGNTAAKLQEALGIAIVSIPPDFSECEFPEMKLLNLVINEPNLLPSLLNLLPAENQREIETKRFAWAVSFTEIVLLILALFWTFNLREAHKESSSLLNAQEKKLQSVQVLLQKEQGNVLRLEQMKKEIGIVKEYLKQKKTLYLYLESLPLLIPENVYLQSVNWGTTTSSGQTIPPTTTAPQNPLSPAGENNILTLNGKVDSVSPDERYSLFSKFLNNLKSSPFVEKVVFQTDTLLSDGLFQINVYIKRILPEDATQ
jgi:hypothetical protein